MSAPFDYVAHCSDLMALATELAHAREKVARLEEEFRALDRARPRDAGALAILEGA
jgi:hypothetical protein